MSLALTDDHRALAEVARTFLADRGALGAARATLETDTESLPSYWDELRTLGWAGMHLGEDVGGQGYGLGELAIVVEELGRCVAPGPFLPTVWASGVVAAAGLELPEGLVDATALGAVGLGGSLRVRGSASGGVTVDGDAGEVLGAGLASVLVLVAGEDAVLVEAGNGVTVGPARGLDPTRRLARVSCDGAAGTLVAGGAAHALRIGRVLAAAEAAGGARACLEMAVDYAKQREQFGRVIGSFQAVKHHCSNMLVAVELAAAVAWDAAAAAADAEGDLAAAIAATRALPAFSMTAETNIQILGGIGFTWEHDAHLYLRRSAVLAAVFDADAAAAEVAATIAGGVSPRVELELPPEAEAFRVEAREFRERHDALDAAGRHEALVESGYFVPHWPEPWGRAAGAVEQLVIDEELAGVEQARLGIGGWVMLTIVQHGSDDQVARWVRPALDGDEKWCQLFSEPDAGSDAAAIQTRATRVDGGWLINGQKVWTSGALDCDRGLATVRTDPTAAKHAGVTMVAIDLAAKGVEIRPLREITGDALFNEVFFDDVFVPDDDVVGGVDQGWTVARATLGNERVSIGGGGDLLGMAVPARGLLPLLADSRLSDVAAGEVGALLAESHAMSVLNLRQVARAIAGGPPGPEGNVSKLLAAEHTQRVAALALRLGGVDVLAEGDATPARGYLFARCLTIAGGTSEIVRNVIAERILGLPRDPLQG